MPKLSKRASEFIAGTAMVLIYSLMFVLGDHPVQAKENDTYLSPEVIEIIEAQAYERNISPELVEALIEKESSGKADAKNGSCRGLMQINANAHKGLLEKYGATEDDLYDPETNIKVGCDLLLNLFMEYEDTEYVLSAYHGERSIEFRLEHGLESSFVRKILERAMELEKLHGK